MREVARLARAHEWRQAFRRLPRATWRELRSHALLIFVLALGFAMTYSFWQDSKDDRQAASDRSSLRSVQATLIAQTALNAANIARLDAIENPSPAATERALNRAIRRISRTQLRQLLQRLIRSASPAQRQAAAQLIVVDSPGAPVPPGRSPGPNASPTPAPAPVRGPQGPTGPQGPEGPRGPTAPSPITEPVQPVLDRLGETVQRLDDQVGRLCGQLGLSALC